MGRSNIKGCKFLKSEKEIIFVVFLVFLQSITFGQERRTIQERRGNLYVREQLEVLPYEKYDLIAPASFTGLTIRLENTDSFVGSYIIVGEDTFLLTNDIHAPKENQPQSNLLVIDPADSTFSLYSGEIMGTLQIIYLNAGKSSKQENQNERMSSQQNYCEKPVTVDQLEWRAGLPPPSYNRSFNNVSHLIIHHAATSNTLTNYSNVVRNIYLYHTEVNGWSDIGYNYLIAQDGTIFNGRDPAEGEQDDVMGAHFCGKNSETMGICLLGDFRYVEPTEATLKSLVHVLTWKSTKENLIPMAFSSHPSNSSLGTIAGHRDGCSTDCPGQNVYEKIDSLKVATAEKMANCEEEPEDKSIIVINPVRSNELTLKFVAPSPGNLRVFNMQGKESLLTLVSYEKDGTARYDVEGLASGLYIVLVPGSDNEIAQKIIIF